MKIRRFTFNMFAVNTYVVWDEASGEAAIVDPGMVSAYDNRRLTDFITDNKLTVKHLINTHLHVDHAIGNGFVTETYGTPMSANSKDGFLGQAMQGQARMFGLDIDVNNVTINHELNNGDRIALGDDYLEVLEVPGHSPGSIALYSPSGKFVITGDALFSGSIGRTDLPGGNQKQLTQSIMARLFTLPDDTTVYPGHGPDTTIGYEKQFNPFF